LCENWKLFRGTPSRYWLEHELVEVFGVDLVPSAETADAIYDQIAAAVADPEFRPRALLDRFNIEVISTTDSAATSELRHHAKLAADGVQMLLGSKSSPESTRPRTTDFSTPCVRAGRPLS
jgi:glucuronate isomerase